MRIERAIALLGESDIDVTDNHIDDLRAYQVLGYTHVCEWCGRHYYRGEDGDRQFCSEDCMDEYIAQ